MSIEQKSDFLGSINSGVDPAAAATASSPLPEIDAVIVGAGFAGLYMLHRLRSLGFDARVIEAGGGVGGTWYWNRYPGARCDIESMEYSYQFSDELQQDWEWSERYASQPEIMRYANHVADRFDLRKDIAFDTRVVEARLDEAASRWVIRTDLGETIAAKFCIMATGCLSTVNVPDIRGQDQFAGATYHTGQWPHEGVDFTGKRVGVIGTGSSAVQSIPMIAEQAAHLYVFQRTPTYSVPAYNGPLNPELTQQIKTNYRTFREENKQMPLGLRVEESSGSVLDLKPDERARVLETRWKKGGLPFLYGLPDFIFNQHANDAVAEFLRDKIRETVKDPAVAEKLSPYDVAGCRRLCLNTDYFETFNRSNVTLVDIKSAPIKELTEQGLRTSTQAYALDCLVFATGFDAMTGALNRIKIAGKSGLLLSEKWKTGPRTYLGLAMVGFPNLFIIAGPGSPSVLSNMLPSIEQHVEWIADCINYADQHQVRTIEPSEDAQDQWVAHVNEVADATLFPTCNSWYLGANLPGKPRVFMPYIGVPPYVERCQEVARNGYTGFILGV